MARHGTTRFPHPIQRKLREFLGFVNFYNRFISNCAYILSPLTLSYVRNISRVIYNGPTKLLMPSMRCLRRQHCWPIPNPMPLSVLQQMLQSCGRGSPPTICRQWLATACLISKSLTPKERRYSTCDWELLGIYLAIIHFRYAVEGWQFHVLTDHKPLT